MAKRSQRIPRTFVKYTKMGTDLVAYDTFLYKVEKMVYKPRTYFLADSVLRKSIEYVEPRRVYKRFGKFAIAIESKLVGAPIEWLEQNYFIKQTDDNTTNSSSDKPSSKSPRRSSGNPKNKHKQK